MKVFLHYNLKRKHNDDVICSYFDDQDIIFHLDIVAVCGYKRKQSVMLCNITVIILFICRVSVARSVTRDLATSVEVWEISTGSVEMVLCAPRATGVLDVPTTHSDVLTTTSV